MISWCKRCFGIRTLRERFEEELLYAELEAYSLFKSIQKSRADLAYQQARIKYLRKELG